MKIIIISMLVFLGCSKKYMNYPVIEKSSFQEEGHRPSTPPPMIKAKKEVEEFCEGQIFFNKNAFKVTESSIRSLVNYSCPGSEYLIDAKITKMWWTVLVYSRSCVTVESYCPMKTRKK